MKPTILFVDDDPNVTSALKRRLRHEPYRILEAHSGLEALELLSKEGAAVIVTDESMPGMTGSQLLSEARRLYPETVRMILTGNASLNTAMRAINEGQIYRFLLKPCNEVELVVSIKLALEQQRLSRENRELTRRVNRQANILEELEKKNPGITHVCRDSTGAILISDIGDGGLDSHEY